jgi:hypothetical protein
MALVTSVTGSVVRLQPIVGKTVKTRVSPDAVQDLHSHNECASIPVASVDALVGMSADLAWPYWLGYNVRPLVRFDARGTGLLDN